MVIDENIPLGDKTSGPMRRTKTSKKQREEDGEIMHFPEAGQ